MQFMNTEPPSALTWLAVTTDQGIDLTIDGPRGPVGCAGIIWVTGRRDYIEECYWAMVNSLDGVYHCCFTDRCLWR